MYNFFTIIFLVIAVLLSGIILMQAGKGHGLAGIFGGDNMQSMLGPKAADVLEKITWGVAVVFFLFTIVLSLMVSQDKGSVLDKIPLSRPKPPVQKTEPLSTGTVKQTTDTVEKKIQATGSDLEQNIQKSVTDINKAVVDTGKTAEKSVTTEIPVKVDSIPTSGE